MDTQEITPKEKQAVEKPDERTQEGRWYVPDVDIFENDEGIFLRADMPGVDEDRVSVELHEGVLSLSGEVSTKPYEGLSPIHTEYGVGSYARRFHLPDPGRFDTDRISAAISRGVLEVRIPKHEKVKPRKIEVRAGG